MRWCTREARVGQSATDKPTNAVISVQRLRTGTCTATPHLFISSYRI
jgi:hypothetical protein